MKVVVTGYRHWKDAQRVYQALREVFPDPMGGGRYNLLAVGDCPTGGDLHAKVWWTAHMNHAMFLQFDAHWTDLGHMAGPVRNNAMIDMIVPDLVLAFLHPLSRGARGCADYAEEKLIPVTRLWEY